MSDLLNPHADNDVGLLQIGGLDVTCAFENCSFNVDKTNVNTGGPCREGDFNETMSRQGTLSGSFFGRKSDGFATNYLDLSGISIGGISVKPLLYELNLSGSFGKQKLPSFASGQADGVLKKNYSGNVVLQLDDSDVAQTLMIAASGSNQANAQMYLDFVLNGREIKVPILLNGTAQTVKTGEYQKVTIPFLSQAPAKGNPFPAIPTQLPGSPGLLDWAILTPRAHPAFAFASKLVHGIGWTGFLTWESFAFKIASGEIVMFDYVFKTYGDFTAAITTG